MSVTGRHTFRNIMLVYCSVSSRPTSSRITKKFAAASVPRCSCVRSQKPSKGWNMTWKAYLTESPNFCHQALLVNVLSATCSLMEHLHLPLNLADPAPERRKNQDGRHDDEDGNDVLLDQFHPPQPPGFRVVFVVHGCLEVCHGFFIFFLLQQRPPDPDVGGV